MRKLHLPGPRLNFECEEVRAISSHGDGTIVLICSAVTRMHNQTLLPDFKYGPMVVSVSDAEDQPLAQKDKEGWVSVSERLPEPGTVVLCRGASYDSGYQDDCFLARRIARHGHPGETMWLIGKQCDEPESVTHWMPLPEPPKEQ